MIRKKTINQIVQHAITHLEQNSELSMFNPGSTTRALIDSLASEMAGLYTITDRAMLQAFVSSASGVFLDLIGEMVGIRRRSEVAAYTTQSDKNIRFYTTSGTLRDYITSIPSGATITSADGLVVFVVDESYSIPENATEYYVTARAQTVGAGGNIGIGGLTTHNLGSNNVFVENREGIKTASGTEDDRALRYRIRYAVRSAEGSNFIAVRIAALSVPGVADVVINPFSMGSGSFDIILLPQGNRVPAAALADVRSAVANVVSFGINFEIREPRYVPFSLVAELIQPNVPDHQTEQMKVRVSGAIQNYIGTLAPNETLVINRIREVALGIDRRISDIRLKEIRVYGRPLVIANYILKPDEVFIPDPDLAEPFAVR